MEVTITSYLKSSTNLIYGDIQLCLQNNRDVGLVTEQVRKQMNLNLS